MSEGQLAVVITHVLYGVAAASPHRGRSAADVKPVAIKNRPEGLFHWYSVFFIFSRFQGNSKSNFQESEGVT